MNVITPLIFAALAINPQTESTDSLVDVEVFPLNRIETVVPVDTLREENLFIVSYDVLGQSGGTRRVLLSYNDKGEAVDVIDGGLRAQSGFIERLYFTDRRHDTMTAWFEIGDSRPVITRTPEGSYQVEFSDNISLTVLNHDTAEQEYFTLRDNQVVFRIGDDGRFSLYSIRPKANDVAEVSRYLRIYDMDSERSDEPMDASALGVLLSRLFPLPGKVDSGR